MGIAWLKGTTGTVKLRIRNYRPIPVVGSITMQALRLQVPNDAGGWDVVALTVSPTTSQSFYIPTGASTEFTYTYTGLPNHVALGILEAKYDMPCHDEENGAGPNNGTNGNFEPWEWQYVLDAAPIGLQAIPWADFLQYACRWGYGAIGAADVKVNMTNGMHLSTRSPAHRLQYVSALKVKYVIEAVNDKVPPYDPNDVTPGKLKVKWFTSDMDSSPTVYMQCDEFSAYLQLAMAAHGVTTESRRYHGYNGNVLHDFTTNLICPANFDRNNPGNYATPTFHNHVAVADVGDRYDSSCSSWKTPYGVLHKNPAAPFGFPAWFQNVISGVPYGLVKDPNPCAGFEWILPYSGHVNFSGT
ncbi:MAG: hypothetical protein ABL949_14130 [Fimbriimonadaceae bacterium]